MWEVNIIISSDVDGTKQRLNKTINLKLGTSYILGSKDDPDLICDASFENEHVKLHGFPNGLLIENLSKFFGVYEKVPYMKGNYASYKNDNVRGLMIGYWYLDFQPSYNSFHVYKMHESNPTKQISLNVNVKTYFQRKDFDDEIKVSSNHGNVYTDGTNLFVCDGTIEKPSTNGTWIWCKQNALLTTQNQFYCYRVGYDMFLYLSFKEFIEPKITFVPELNPHVLKSLEEENNIAKI